MPEDRRQELIQLLADIDQQVTEAQRIMVDCPETEVILAASAQLVELRTALERVETLLRKSRESRPHRIAQVRIGAPAIAGYKSAAPPRRGQLSNYGKRAISINVAAGIGIG